ncbi:hypothetical protein GDO81_027452 [Engystomops pustulosus]|uniref:Uncharacterized protein n=1 Tax=Engystomops pustulosus TaxID=76066 RepID=A0AAV6YFT0_ENGPU|nr:hypothetical protein GDO81_027452 [Engystomops pustulosus]
MHLMYNPAWAVGCCRCYTYETTHYGVSSLVDLLSPCLLVQPQPFISATTITQRHGHGEWAWLPVAPPTVTRLQRNSIRSGRGCVPLLHCSGSHTEQVTCASTITPQQRLCGGRAVRTAGHSTTAATQLLSLPSHREKSVGV